MRAKIALALGMALGCLAPGFSYADGFGASSASIEMSGPFGSLNVDPSESMATSLRIAAREGHIKEVQRLIDQGVDVNGSGEFGETALMYAARFAR
jgi:ankyrin repeat protein